MDFSIEGFVKYDTKIFKGWSRTEFVAMKFYFDIMIDFVSWFPEYDKFRFCFI